MPKTYTCRNEYLYQFALKIDCLAFRLKMGENGLQLGVLFTYYRAFEKQSDYPRFYLFLLKKTLEYFQDGRSLSQKEYVDREQKEAYLKTGIRLLELYLTKPSLSLFKEIDELYQVLWNLAPHMRRASRHVWPRWRLEDPDLLILREILSYLSESENLGEWDTYFLGRYYCCELMKGLYHPKAHSAQRLRDLSGYLRSLAQGDKADEGLIYPMMLEKVGEDLYVNFPDLPTAQGYCVFYDRWHQPAWHAKVSERNLPKSALWGFEVAIFHSLGKNLLISLPDENRQADGYLWVSNEWRQRIVEHNQVLTKR